MGFKAMMDGRKAYSLHVAGNRLYDSQEFKQAQEKYDQALNLYQSALSQGYEDARTLMAYSVLLLRQHKFEQAHDLMLKIEKLPKLSPSDKRQLRLNYAICQWKRGRLDKAIELMKQVGADGMTSTIYGSLGYMLIEKAIQTGDFSEAEAFNAEAYEYDDEDAVTLDNLGQLALAQGKRDEALDYFKRAIGRKPTQVDTLYYLGKIYHENGDDATARKYLERLVNRPYSALCTTTKEQAQALMAQLK